MTEWAAKKFWSEVRVARSEVGSGFRIFLDDKPLNTPAKNPLILLSKEMANALASEWLKQVEKIDPSKMPFTRFANSSIDKVRFQMDDVVRLISDYGDSDLICYRAESPRSLIACQEMGWDPLVKWAEQELKVSVKVFKGIMHFPQSNETLNQLEKRVRLLTEFQLAGFHDLVSLSGSLILSFALVYGHISCLDAWNLSRIDEIWQIENWGEDEDAQKMVEKKFEAFSKAATFYRFS
ncbi:MAG: ATPase [Proteobacteria bacterium]|nr:ATPase [Pseudomonadota bacterium]